MTGLDTASPTPAAFVRRLHYLEGIRGITASYVLLFHVVQGFLDRPTSTLAKVIFRLTAFGHEAVAIFIVVSGFCLTLSAAKASSPSAEPVLNLGLGRFAKRRARRILPPYFASCFVSLALIALFPLLRSTQTGTIWDNSSPAFSVGSLASHALLFHHWFPHWKFTINGPLWSVAAEWQIYFLFALLLFPIRKRWGPWAVLALSFVIGYAPLWIAPSFAASAITWYVPLFTLGMCACLGTLKGATPERAWLSRLSLGIWASVLAAIVGVFGIIFAQVWFRSAPLSDLAVGLASASVLSALAHQTANSRRSWLMVLLESRPLVALGDMSYSLYLTHLPVVALVALSFRGRLGVGSGEPIAITVLSLLASLAFGAAFYWSVEKRFL